MNYSQKRNFLIDFCYYGVLLITTAVGVKVLWKYLSPFVIAFLVAYLLKPTVNKINVYTKIRRSVCAVICVGVFYTVAITVIIFTGAQLVMTAQNIFFALPDYYAQEILPVIENAVKCVQNALVRIDPGIMDVAEEYASLFTEKAASAISDISVSALGRISAVVTVVPGIFIRVMFTVVASFFISVDYYNITCFIARQLNTRQLGVLYEAEIYARSTVVRYIRSYSLILFITFCEISLGLKIMGISYPLLTRSLIAVFDILPAVGTGGIIIPWGIIKLFMGDIPLGIGMLTLYLVITVVRNIVEPQVLGESVGLHPVAALMGMALGGKLIGVAGVFGVPVFMVVLKQLNDSGKIKLYK
ncbi:MAG: sporulation integral membrane protein YtvI [Oscillospiraceae bacterium]|nr:sporulation integral membrane protein YtvI [Oscillospiraceae bacterium]